MPNANILDNELPADYAMSLSLSFTDAFSAGATGTQNEQYVMFDDGRIFLQMTMTAEQIKHAYSLFSTLYEDCVSAGTIEPYTDIGSSREPESE